MVSVVVLAAAIFPAFSWATNTPSQPCHAGRCRWEQADDYGYGQFDLVSRIVPSDSAQNHDDHVSRAFRSAQFQAFPISLLWRVGPSSTATRQLRHKTSDWCAMTLARVVTTCISTDLTIRL